MRAERGREVCDPCRVAHKDCAWKVDQTKDLKNVNKNVTGLGVSLVKIEGGAPLVYVFMNTSIPGFRVRSGTLMSPLVEQKPPWVICEQCWKSPGAKKLCLHTGNGRAWCPWKLRPKCMDCRRYFNGEGVGKICDHQVSYSEQLSHDRWFALLLCVKAEICTTLSQKWRGGLCRALMNMFGIKLYTYDGADSDIR